MNRLNAGLVLLIGLLVAPLATEAQQSGRVYRVGYLSTPTRESVEHGLAAFLRTLRELGWIEGQNLIIEYRWAEGNVEQLPDLAAELVHRRELVLPLDPLGHDGEVHRLRERDCTEMNFQSRSIRS